MLNASREISFDDVIFVDRTVFSKVHWDRGYDTAISYGLVSFSSSFISYYYMEFM